MGASNFWQLKLAKNIYSFGMWLEEWDEYVMDDIITSVRDDIENLWISPTNKWWADSTRTIWYYTIESYDKKNNENRYITLRMFIEYWYHDWARFDVEVYDEYGDVTKTMYKQMQTMVNKINKVYKKHTTPLKVMARFSNGETRYAKA